MAPQPDDAAYDRMTSEDKRRDAQRISSELLGRGGTDPFAAAVRATRMPMVISNPRLPDNPVIFVNDSFCRLTGYQRQDIVGRNCRFLQGPETDRAAVARIKAAVAEARPLEIDIRNHRRNGEPFWNRLLMAPVRDADGELAYFFASQVDVTLELERLEGLETANAALLAEVAGRGTLLRNIIEAAPGLIYAKDRQGRMLIANSATLDLIGKSWPDVSGRTDREILSDTSQAEAVMNNDRRIMQGGRTEELEESVSTANGVPRVFLSTKTPLRDPDGKIAGMVGVSLDITARKRAEAELQQLNATLEARVAERTAERDRAWRNSQDLIAVVDETGVFRAVNPAWTSLLGWQPEELIGRNHLDFNHPDDHQASAAALVTASSGHLPTYESRILASDGSTRWIAWVASPEAGLVYATGRHVTAEREAAAALARTEELLRQSQKMEAVGQLTGGIAHDFNNLLTAISGSLEMLQRRIATGQTRDLERYTSAAIVASRRAAALTQRLLAFARRQPLDARRVDTNRLVAGMEEMLRRTLGPAVELEMVLAGGLWATLCDANQLESAILNLAINARDAMPEGGRLTIETSNAHLDDAYARSQGGEVRPGQYVAVAVTDTGSGMTPDVVARAFDPFFTTKPIGRGTGLGLSMLYGFVKQSDGHVRIYSEPDAGTTFRLYLPRLRAPAEESEAEAELRHAPGFDATPGETVLVVDDEPALRMLVSEVLHDMGYHTIEAADGPGAVRILQSDVRIDLLVTDVGLPGLNGRQVADAARVSRPGLRVLFITGYAHNAALANGTALEPGMEIMTKPFALDALGAKIRDMIEAP
jgi:PAS domain S-box-containing protein